MKIHYNRKTLPYKIILLAIFIVEMHFFGLVTLPSAIEFVVYTNRSKWVAVVAILMACVCWRNYGKGTLKSYRGFLKKYLTVVTVSVVILYIHAIIMYPLNDLLTTYGLGTYYFYAFLAVAMLYIFEQENGFEDFLKMVNIVTAIMYIVSIIQGIHYLRTGGLLFASASSEIIGGMIRDGKVRIDAGAFSNIMLIYNIYNLYNLRRKNRRNSFVSMIVIVLGVLNVYFTGQSRIMLLTVMVSVVVLIFIGDGTTKKKLVSGIALFVGAIAIVFSSVSAEFLSSFSSLGDYAGSTIARTNAWVYYFNKFLENPIFAIGFAGDVNYYDLVHGNSGVYYQTLLVRYYYSDVGFIGQLAITGIFSIGIYLWPLFHMIKIVFHFIRQQISKQGAFLIALVCYLVSTSATLIILDANRVIAFPLVIAIFEYSFKHYKEEKKIQIM